MLLRIKTKGHGLFHLYKLDTSKNFITDLEKLKAYLEKNKFIELNRVNLNFTTDKSGKRHTKYVDTKNKFLVNSDLIEEISIRQVGE